ncbi:MAG: cupin [Candidatus Poribacteria bacterium]|nr:MAG: cupin [Candidatus Poribacteria bacterium]
MPFYRVEEIEPFEQFQGVHLQIVSGERVMLSFVRFDPDGVVPEHSHPHEQMGTVLEGAFELVIAGERRTVQVGDAYWIPGGVPHSARALGRPALALDIFSPPREEYLRRAGSAGGEERWLNGFSRCRTGS